jgi:hypothetical protein
MRTLSQTIAFGEVAARYQVLRAQFPAIRARTIKLFIDRAEGESMQEFQCAVEHGHDWSYTGTAYGGDDESYGGEGRVYCRHCGTDGDA